MPEMGLVFRRESDKKMCSGAIVAPAETREKELGLSKKRFALLLVFPAVIALAVMLIAATGAGAASKRVSPAAQGAKSSASSASAGGVRAPSGSCAISEGFDDITNLPDWAMINHSEPLGLTDWFQGNDVVFPSHSGASTSYIGANYNNTADTGTISNWLLTPVVTIQDGSSVTFWTRTVAGSIYPDRLQIRASTTGDSTNVGTSSTDVGDFTHLLLDINDTYQMGGYPEDWTSFTATVADVPTAMTGRFAFRYFVENGGPTGANSNYIGIDDACVATAASAHRRLRLRRLRHHRLRLRLRHLRHHRRLRHHLRRHRHLRRLRLHHRLLRRLRRPPPPPPPVRCRVPRVLGLRLGAAKTKIRRAHCSVGNVRRVRSRRSLRGRVVNQSPRPGTIKRRNFPVKLAVGRG